MPQLYLSLEELREIAVRIKEDLQRQANQGIRKKDWEQGVGALASMEAIDSFLYAASLRAGEYSPVAAERHQSPGVLKKKKRGAKITQLPVPVPLIRKRVGGE